jgi:prepilin-type N-terminal cleavage/methylation domain-containing protein
MHKNYKRGFTLIELLVVIAIIGILASIVLASLDSARKKGRDARRIADIKQIQLALELYYDANSVYPPALTSANLVTPGYISVLPNDPTNGAAYSYAPWASTGSASTCSSYHLGASLETSNSTSLSSDADVTTLTAGTGETNPSGVVICTATGASADFHGADSAKCASADAGVACYDVRP